MPVAPVEPPPAAPGLGVVIPADLADILLTIRLVESGERYDVPPNRGNASGAYQYIASTWNGYGGYPHAYLAPPVVQDERALADVQAILAAWKGDVSMVPVIWYYPRAAREPALMDVVPVPGAGNRLTVREYQHRWLDVLAFVTGTPARYGATAILPELQHLAGRPPTPSADDADEIEIVFPVLGRTVVAPPADCADCEGADAVMFGQRMQPVLAAVDGVVTAREIDDARSGAVTLTITSTDGDTFHYAGFNDDRPDTDDGDAPEHLRFTSLATIGSTVRAGQIIGFMGDTDPMPGQEHVAADAQPVWPHLRLTITDPDGHRVDADRLVAAAQRRQACHVGIGPWSLPEADDDVDRERVVVSALLDGGWTLHRDGTVTAVGRAALIVPPQDCVWAPAEPFGPGEDGERTPADWDEPLRVNARYWVSALQSTSGSTGPLGPVAAMRP